MSSQLVCPKCAGAMRTYERNGVHIDQCGDCRGIFLDRGELEHLVDAENRHYDRPTPQPSTEYRERDDRPRRDDDYYPRKKKSKASFLGDIFDM